MHARLAFIFLLAIFSAGCSHTAKVSGVVDGKQLQLSPRLQRELADESVRLLKSCTYANLHPTGEYASTIAHAGERSHLQFTFSEPRVVELAVRKREVPSGKVEMGVREMMITLPSSSSSPGAILVRSNQETFYFAMFDGQVSQELENTLKKAQE